MKPCHLRFPWSEPRRMRDSNPRGLAPNPLSKSALVCSVPSTDGYLSLRQWFRTSADGRVRQQLRLELRPRFAILVSSCPLSLQCMHVCSDAFSKVGTTGVAKPSRQVGLPALVEPVHQLRCCDRAYLHRCRVVHEENEAVRGANFVWQSGRVDGGEAVAGETRPAPDATAVDATEDIIAETLYNCGGAGQRLRDT